MKDGGGGIVGAEIAGGGEDGVGEVDVGGAVAGLGSELLMAATTRGNRDAIRREGDRWACHGGAGWW